MGVCPDCGVEIEHVNYSVRMTEWGVFDGQDHNSSDSEWQDNPEYICPECDYCFSGEVEVAESLGQDFEETERLNGRTRVSLVKPKNEERL